MKQRDLIKETEWIKEQIPEEIRKAILSILVYELHEKIEISWRRKQKEEKKVKPRTALNW